ncbi:RHS repeat-associated core domain-containing protein, partial [Flavobacterium sp.]|uniref:RHS repeat domain-containing protein n=1 Tax=Flavobacterium sp. TaxID=239 RepID=UPI0025B95F60
NSDEQMYAKDGSLIRIRPVPPLFTTSYDYKYNGKELQEELSLNIYDMDMRQYDPAIARWVVQDPLVHFNYSPYFAFDNNPILWADPTGADSENGREDMPISRFAHWSDNARGVDRRENGDPSYSLVDVHAISALKGAAKLYFDNEDVSKLTEKEKQKIFETDELKTIGVLLWEFATGTVRDTRIFVYGKHPFANSYLDGSGGSITNEILSDLGEKLYKDGFRKAPKNSKEYSIALEFSPTLSPSSWGPSAAKHLTVNKVQFYIGGAVAKVRIVDGNLRGIITNETSRNSLLFHMAENYNRKDGARPLSTIIQEIQFSFPIQ